MGDPKFSKSQGDAIQNVQVKNRSHFSTTENVPIIYSIRLHIYTVNERPKTFDQRQKGRH